MTRRRVRSMRPLTPISLARSTAPMIVSVTPLGMVGAFARLMLPAFGHSPAAAAGEAKASAATRAIGALLMMLCMCDIRLLQRKTGRPEAECLEPGLDFYLRRRAQARSRRVDCSYGV